MRNSSKEGSVGTSGSPASQSLGGDLVRSSVRPLRESCSSNDASAPPRWLKQSYTLPPSPLHAGRTPFSLLPFPLPSGLPDVLGHSPVLVIFSIEFASLWTKSHGMVRGSEAFRSAFV